MICAHFPPKLFQFRTFIKKNMQKKNRTEMGGWMMMIIILIIMVKTIKINIIIQSN